jgi:hypothetical protein
VMVLAALGATGCFRTDGDDASRASGGAGAGGAGAAPGSGDSGTSNVVASDGGVTGTASCACASHERCFQGRCEAQPVIYVDVSPDGNASVCLSASGRVEEEPMDTCAVRDFGASPDVAPRIGKVRLTGPHSSYELLTWDEFQANTPYNVEPCYYMPNEALTDFRSGDRIRIAATGGPDLDAFEVDIVLPYAPVLAELESDLGKPIAVKWRRGSGPEHMSIVVVDDLSISSKGVSCTALDDGNFVVPFTETSALEAPKHLFLGRAVSHRVEPGARGIAIIRSEGSQELSLR